MIRDRWLAIGKKLAIPLVLAVLTAFGVDHYLTKKTDALEQSSRATLLTRVVADRGLLPGQILTQDDLAAHDVPQAWVGPDAFDPSQTEQIVGKVLLKAMVAGEPFSRMSLANPEPPALSQQLAPGRRAMTLPVDYVSSLSGLLSAGDVIDLFVTFTHDGQRITTLLVSAIKVLATDRPLPIESEVDGMSQQRKVTSVTLDVSPQQAVKLVSANLGGVLTAVLRVDGGGQAQPTQVKADHLPGFVGLEPSFGDSRLPLIIYGDAMSLSDQSP